MCTELLDDILKKSVCEIQAGSVYMLQKRGLVPLILSESLIRKTYLATVEPFGCDAGA